MNKRREHVFITWSLFYSLILSYSGKYRFICSLIVKRSVVFKYLNFQLNKILHDLIGGSKVKFVSIEKEEILIENMAKLYCKAFEKTNFNEMIERMKRHVEYADFKGIVAINDENEVVGFTYGYRSLEGQYYNQLMREALNLEQVEEWLQDCFEFVELAVHPQHQNEGLGTKLHNELLKGILNRTSVLTTQINNEKARSLYERLEWVNILEPFHPSTNDVPYIIMGKTLKTKVN